MLFHYHFWTPHVEETEVFYKERGFQITQRIGKFAGKFQEFNPPLTWDDFRKNKVLFRIIEAKKGAINITFGFGIKIKFDHIGFLVSEEEKDKICQNAKKMNWEIDSGKQRTFIATPYHFRIELQTKMSAIDSMEDGMKINELKLETTADGLDKDLSTLFGQPVTNLVSEMGNVVTIKAAGIKGLNSSNAIDPNGVLIFGY